MKQCKEIIFSGGISEIFENNGKGKVVYGQENLFTSLMPHLSIIVTKAFNKIKQLSKMRLKCES